MYTGEHADGGEWFRSGARVSLLARPERNELARTE